MVLCIKMLLVYVLKLIKFDACHHDHYFVSIMDFIALNCYTLVMSTGLRVIFIPTCLGVH
jgi:hypothetical protein